MLNFTASAHKDRIFAYDGKIITGLPKKYQPTSFDQKSKILIIGKQKIDTSIIFTKLLKTEEYTIQFTGSWYHDTSVMPPYITLNITPKGKLHAIRFIYNLDNGKLIKPNIEKIITKK